MAEPRPSVSPARVLRATVALAAAPALVLLALVGYAGLSLGHALAALVAMIAGLALLTHRHLAGLEAVRRRIEALARDAPQAPASTFSLAEAVGELDRTWTRDRDALRAASAANEAIFEAIPSPLILVDPARRVTRTNNAARALFGENLVGRDFDTVLRHPEVLETADEYLAGRREAATVDIAWPGPPDRHFAVRFARLPDDGSAGSFLLVLHDVTALKQAERMRADFVANVSHELRTPLNAVIGYAEILTQQMFGPMPARYRDYSNDILVSGQHLLEVINDILDMSRIEAGTYTLRLQRLDLAAVIHEAVRFVRDRADKKQQILRLDTAEGLPWAQVDRRAIRQVVINLVGNAIKFTPTGGEIEVALTLKPGQGPEIAVRDNGPGIDPQHLPLVFQPFWQAEEARRRSHEGTGLGLSISHKLVDLHGGRIDIDSAVGRGTTVTVRLPPECLVAAPDPAGLTAPPV